MIIQLDNKKMSQQPSSAVVSAPKDMSGKTKEFLQGAAKGIKSAFDLQSGNTKSGAGQLIFALKILLIAVIAGLIIWGVIALIEYGFERYSKKSTKPNNMIILNDRIEQIRSAYEQRKDRVGGYNDILTATPQDQRAFVNYHVMTTNITGYMGPALDGVFQEKEAVRRAFDVGVRNFVIPIDYLEEARDIPRIVVRDSGGFLRSNNTGSIKEVIKGIAEVRGRNNDPIIITLYFHRLPGETAASTASLNYMSRVAAALEPVAPYHLGMTSQGDYRRQGLADRLFMNDIDGYEGNVIIMTNVDTMGFRTEGLSYKPKDDLDLWTNLRIFGHTETPTTTVGIYGIIDKIYYYTSIPSESRATVSDETRQKFTVAMGYSPIELPSVADTQATMKTGVQCMAYDVFTDIGENGESITKALGFVKSGFTLKEEPLRFKRAAPIVADTPPPQMNANGGQIPTPNIFA